MPSIKGGHYLNSYCEVLHIKEESILMNQLKLRRLLEGFLLEDIGNSDLTSEAIFPSYQTGTGVFTVKDTGIIAGLSIIKEAYALLDSTIEVDLLISEGEKVESHQPIAEVRGPIIHLLSGERVILNLLQRMSGIATLTNLSIKRLNDPTIQLCDTRKTTPGLSMLEKYAVRIGGGKNHRNGLYDGVLIKDNHVSFCGSITNAVTAVRKQIGHTLKVEVEAETEEQVLEAVAIGADIIMLDNCTPERVKNFTELIPKTIITEASGGITLQNLHEYANTGVDYISLGFLTHSVRSLDISLNIKTVD